MLYKPPEKYRSRVPEPPSLVGSTQRLSHSLPLAIHLAILSVTVTMSVCISIISHYIAGPIKASWNLRTSIVHSALHSALTLTSPQGKHSMFLTSILTNYLKIPQFLLSSNVVVSDVKVSNAKALSNLVKNALKITGLKHQIIRHDRIIPGEWIIDPRCDNDYYVLYLHGGAHIHLSPGTHRFLTSAISSTLKARVFVPDYGLCPEVLFPGAIEDALACYLAMLGQSIDGIECRLNGEKIDASKIIIMGDSSGACLTLQLLQVISSLQLPMPAASILLSPFIDSEINSGSWTRNFHSDFMALEHQGVRWAMDVYANGLDKSHPVLSPLNGKMTGFPPMLIIAGDSEVVTDDAIRLYENCCQQGVLTTFDLFKDMFHVFPTFTFLPEAKEAMVRIRDFVKSLGDNWSDSGVSVSELNRRNLIRIIDERVFEEEF